MKRKRCGGLFAILLFMSCMTPAIKGDFAEKPVKRIVTDTVLPEKVSAPVETSQSKPDTAVIISQSVVQTLRVPKNSVRILLSLPRNKKYSVKLNGRFIVKCADTIFESTLESYSIVFNKDGTAIDDIENAAGKLIAFEPTGSDCRFSVNGTTYRGILQFVSGTSIGNIVVNEVLVEDYLKGVLPYEIGKRDSSFFEALKAQALVARTYTYSKLMYQKRDEFDLYDDQNDQVYKGTEREYDLANAAVDSTYNTVVVCRDSLIQSFYFSTSPGRTANIEEMWPDRGHRTYLRSIDDDQFNRSSPHYNWEESWTRQELEKNLHKSIPLLFKGGSRGTLTGISIAERAECGRVKILRIEMGGQTYEVKGDRVRWALMRKSAPELILKSSFFTLDVEKKGSHIVRITVKGGGFGHGIGMSQIGALNMAKEGYSAERIITTYYTGVNMSRIVY